MCVSLYLKEENREIDNYGQLKSLVGEDNISWFPGYTKTKNDEWCLCGIDLKETMKNNGFKVSQEEHGLYFDVEK